MMFYCRNQQAPLASNDPHFIRNAQILQCVAQFIQISIMITPTSSLEQPFNIFTQEYQDLCLPENQDLYDILLNEPTIFKKPSVLYDYSPNPTVLHASLNTSAEQGNIYIPLKQNSTSTETSIQQGVKRCTCSKSKCQKNYCECFKLGITCGIGCACIDCGNKQKLFSAKSFGEGIRCRCQKSKCSKKYCECHLNGRRCTSECRCTQCSNFELLEDCLELENSKPKKLRKTM